MTSIPEQWSGESLGRILSAIEAGRNFRCIEKPPEDGNPGVVKVSAVTWGTFDELESKTCPDPRMLNERYLIRPGDLLISRANTLELVGACVLVGPISRRLMLSDKILRLVMPEELKRWVLWFLRSKAGRAQIEAKASGNQLSMRNIGQEGIRSIELPVAPPVEREQIVASIESHFSRLDAATATLERVQRNIERYRASVLKAAVEGRLVPTEADLAKREGRTYEPASTLLKRILTERRRRWEEAELAKLTAKGKKPTDDKWKAKYEEPAAPDVSGLPELPEGWCWARLDALCDSITDGDHLPPPQVDNGLPFLVIGDVRTGTISFEGCRKVPEDYFASLSDSRKPRRGDLLYTVTGSFGIPVLVTTDQPFCVQRHIAILRPAPETDVRYLRHALATSMSFAQAAAIATGTAQKTVPLRGLRRFAIPIPPLAEQRRSSDTVEALSSVLAFTEDRVASDQMRIARLRQSILKWAFEGRLVQPATEQALVEADPAGSR